MADWIPGFSSPLGAALFGLLVPLIIFYFLKLRRTRLEIPSLVLWRQVISDQRVNAPFQRFKRNLLLLLQVLLLSLLALAATQPYWRGASREGQYLPILIDVSASMAAKDPATGVTRLDQVKEQVSELINGLLPGQMLSLIAVSSNARRLTEFTDNRPVLLNALRSLQPADAASKIEDGLRLAQALSRTNRVDVVRLYSDGNLATRPDPTTGEPLAVVDFDLPYRLDFHRVGAPTANIGITALNARRASTERWDVFVRVEGGAAASSAARVELRDGDDLIGEEQVILAAGESQRLVFQVDADRPASLAVRLTPEGADALASDNAAWLELPAGRELLVSCPISLSTFRHALRGIPGVVLDPPDDGKSLLSSHDLVITDAAADSQREATTRLFVGVVPEDLAGQVSVGEGGTDVVDWRRDAPLLQHVQLRDVQLIDRPARGPDVTDEQIESLGYEILAFGGAGPLILQRRDGPRLSVHLVFHTDRSTLPYRVGFPVFVNNLVNLALQQAELTELSAAATGTLPRVVLSPGEIYRVTGPSGAHHEQMTDDDGVLAGVPAPEVGQYEIRRGGELARRLGAALLNSTETSRTAVNEIQLNDVAVSAQAEQLRADKPWWRTLVLLALGFLLVEWWVFQKRPGGLPG